MLWIWTLALETGYRGPYPWSKLVQWWHEEAPVDIDKTNDRRDPILAAPLVMVDRESRLARLYSPPGRLVRRDDGQAYLPGFAPGEEWGSKLPCLPLALYDLGKHDVVTTRARRTTSPATIRRSCPERSCVLSQRDERRSATSHAASPHAAVAVR